MYEFKLPDVGEGIHEAAIANWLVKVGDTVALDQPMVDIETDKSIVQIPAPVAGIIAEIPLREGATARVGDLLVVIQTAQSAAPAPAKTPAAKPAPATGIAGPGQRVLASPAVRKRALELGVDLSQVPGSAAAGRVTLEDLLRFAEQPPAAAPEPQPAAASSAAPIVAEAAEHTEHEPLKGIRLRIAQRMETAWRIPRVTSFEEVDVSKLVKLRKKLNALIEPDLRLTYTPFIVKAVIQALKEYPYFNASLDLDAQRIALHRHHHIGIATATPDGLLVPVVRHAEQLGLRQLAAELTRLAEAARERRLGPADLTGSTFSITNVGSFGGGQGTPIINPPESAILGCARIEHKPVAIKRKVKIRPVLPLTLSFDHRLHDGAAAARFLNRIKALLTEPKALFL